MQPKSNSRIVTVLKSGSRVPGDSAGNERAEEGAALLSSLLPPAELSLASQRSTLTAEQHWAIAQRTGSLLLCVFAWLLCSFLDAKYTPRKPGFAISWKLIAAYQWCMVGYLCCMILTFLKVIFETNVDKLRLHMVSCYINLVAAGSYAMLWTGFSPVGPDIGSCLFVPQRWLLYIFTVPAIFHILGQISEYSPRKKLWVDLLNIFIMTTGGIATIPWISLPHKVLWWTGSMAAFPPVLIHMWRMVSSAIDEVSTQSTSKAGIKFVRIFTVVLYCTFPVMYFAAIAGVASVEAIEPMWAFLDWLIKMVYSSSLMETNFFVVQRRESVLRAVEEANKIKTIQQLSTAIERKDDFLSTMSHELRTPLNGIIGLSESLELGSAGALPDKAVQVISTVRHSGKRLLQLINDILDAAKMKQGMLVIKHEQVNMKRLVTDVLDISSTLVHRNVKLVNTIGNVPAIVGDTGRIVQILYNLVGNAAKFTRSGTITVSSGVSSDGQRLFVSVADTGCGVPQDKISKIFGAFEQVDMSTTRHYGGTGLGLHLVKELVKAHNGDITVESEVNKGSTFTVWLPFTQDSQSMAEYSFDSSAELVKLRPFREGHEDRQLGPELYRVIEEEQRGQTGSDFEEQLGKPMHRDMHGSCMVLSVDDDPINQMVVENLLTPEGYRVEQAMDGTEALAFLANAATLPDIILLDVMMPGMNGYEVCQEIRKSYNSVQIPIIMVSAKGNPEDVMAGLQAGACDYVKKPFHRQELLTRIRTQIRNREIFQAEVQNRSQTEVRRSIDWMQRTM